MALSFFAKTHIYHEKEESANFSTEADLASEKIVFDFIKQKHPDDSFLSEEMGFVQKKGNRIWVLDPIDGTVNFSHGQPLWGVSLAVFYEKELQYGAIYLPVLKDLFFAQKGRGVFLNNQKIQVSDRSDMNTALIGFETAYPSGRRVQKFPFDQFLRKTPSVIGLSLSTVYDLAAIAGGRLDGFIEESTCIWDIAAGTLLVEEAGGLVCDWKGHALKWEWEKEKKYNLIAGNRPIQKQLLFSMQNYLKKQT